MTSSIPKTMKAWRKHRGTFEPLWEEVPVPSTPKTGFLCKMLASGVCNSDHSLLTNDKQRPWFQEKYILGHEGCGEIVSIGEGVTDPRFKIGDKIAMLAVPGCGSDTCSECSRDLPQLCPHGHHSGIGQDGFYAPYAVIDVRGAVPLPPGVTPQQAAVATDAVTTAYHAITRRAEVKASETVFLFGLGGLGFNALQIIHRIGARVIVSDTRQERLDAAAELGIPRKDLVPPSMKVQDFVRESDVADKIDTVVDFVGTKQTFEDSQHIVRLAGTIVNVGTMNLENTIHMKIGIRKRLTFKFSYGGQLRDLKEILDLIGNKEIDPQVEDGKLEDFPEVLKRLLQGKVKARIALVHQ